MLSQTFTPNNSRIVKLTSYFKMVASYLLASLMLFACNATEKKEVVSHEYNLEEPDKFNMPESLFEISGITFREGAADTIYAIQDEDGKVFFLPWDVPRQHHTKFSKKGDYEDLAILHDTMYVLKSNGHIFRFPLAESGFEEPENVKEFKGLLSEGEYEGMYADEASGALHVLCKKCIDDDSKKSVTGYIFKPAGDSLAAAGTFAIHTKEIAAITGKVSRGFRPSGLARNPVTKDWYVISAVNKLIVVADSEWKVKNAYTLNGNLFLQPEGIAFDAEGNLYISNEGDDLFSGNILKFKRTRR